ncbi:MAG: hypothetical protein H7839_23855 [Magnetococcus sp. YQC-5]
MGVWLPLQVAVFAVFVTVNGLFGADLERVHRRVGAGPFGVDPSPVVNNAPLLRPVAVCARVGMSEVLSSHFRRGAAGGAGGGRSMAVQFGRRGHQDDQALFSAALSTTAQGSWNGVNGRLDVGREAGVKLESVFLDRRFFPFYIGWFRLIDSSAVILAVCAVVVFRRVGRRQKAFDLLVVHPAEHAGVVPSALAGRDAFESLVCWCCFPACRPDGGCLSRW